MGIGKFSFQTELATLKSKKLENNVKRKKKGRKRKNEKDTENECFRCGLAGDLILCDMSMCPKGYHLHCLELKESPKGRHLSSRFLKMPPTYCIIISFFQFQQILMIIGSTCFGVQNTWAIFYWFYFSNMLCFFKFWKGVTLLPNHSTNIFTFFIGVNPLNRYIYCINFNYLTGKWVCPWHHCDECGNRALNRCIMCPNSYCKTHSKAKFNTAPGLTNVCRDHGSEVELEAVSLKCKKKLD